MPIAYSPPRWRVPLFGSVAQSVLPNNPAPPRASQSLVVAQYWRSANDPTLLSDTDAVATPLVAATNAVIPGIPVVKSWSAPLLEVQSAPVAPPRKVCVLVADDREGPGRECIAESAGLDQESCDSSCLKKYT